MKRVILSIDQGTTGTTVVLVDEKLNLLSKVNHEFPQHFPKPGWVEHHPEEIWESTLNSIREAKRLAGISEKDIVAIGITNQRETTIIWDRETGIPIHPAIVWQDRRTADVCVRLKKKNLEKKIRQKTGLLLDPYFSATKAAWILDHVPGARQKASKGRFAFGTIDSFLVNRLTAGRVHVTDVSNACRTLLMNIKTLKWDKELLRIFNVPKSLLPEIVSSSEVYGYTSGVPGLPDGIPISGMAGDQQAALFGQACFNSGEAKCTYGTGSFLVLNTGNHPVYSKSGLLTSVGWKVGGKTIYILEGSAFIAGAAVQWLRDGLKMLTHASEIEKLASSVQDSGGVTFVPAFVGLGAPHWNSEARGVIHGLTRGTTRAHLARACLEGIAFLQHDILEAMQKDLGKKIRVLKVDGGASTNDLLMHFQADILETPLVRPKMIETTALGAAFLAGLGVGVWKSTAEIAKSWKEDKTFVPGMKKNQVKEHVARWRAVVKKA